MHKLCLLWCTYLKLLLGQYSGTPCKIPYDDGYIYGFFSQDNVKVGDIIIKDQVSILSLSELYICLFGCIDDWWLVASIFQEFSEIIWEANLALLAFPFDGILGLGFQGISVGKVTPVW